MGSELQRYASLGFAIRGLRGCTEGHESEEKEGEWRGINNAKYRWVEVRTSPEAL